MGSYRGHTLEGVGMGMGLSPVALIAAAIRLACSIARLGARFCGSTLPRLLRTSHVGLTVTIIALATVLLGGAAPAGGALSPQPYLDSSFDTNLWNEALSNWPTGFPSSELAAPTYEVSVAVGAMPSLGSLSLNLQSGTFDFPIKITRTSDTKWLDLTGDIGRKASFAFTTNEAWKFYSDTSTAYSATSSTNASLHNVWVLERATPNGCTYGVSSTWTIPKGEFFDASTSGTLGSGNSAQSLDCQHMFTDHAKSSALWSAYVGYGTPYEYNTSSSHCSGAPNGYSGNCWFIYMTSAQMDAALIHSAPAPFTTQSFSATRTVTTPIQSSTNLTTVRNEITSQGCATENEYNASLDATNWARPEPASGPCGGLVSEPAAQTYGPPNSAVPGVPSLAANTSNGSGEPVDMATGSFYASAVDVALPGIGVPFTFTRSYNSADSTSGRLGPGWTDSLAWSVSVDGSGNPTVRSGSGQQLHFTANGSSYLPDPGGRATLSSVTGGGWKLVTRDQTTYLFDSSGELTSEADRNGEGIVLTYDGSGNLASLTDRAGRVISFATSGGLLTGIGLPDGRSISYGYTSGRLTSFTDLRGHAVAYTYDSGGRLATIVDQNGHTVVSNTYDPSSGRVTAQTDARSHSSSFGWNASTGTATYTDPNGHTWTQVYVNNTLRSESDPVGDTTSYSYDGDLNLVAVTNPRGNTTTMTWGANGDLATRTAPAPLSYTESWTYDSLNDVTSYTDGRGHTTSYGYDSKGNLTSITAPAPSGSGSGPVTTYGRDAMTGLVTSLTDPRNKVTSFGYDSAGNLTSVTTPVGYETTYGYDSSGRMTSKVDPRGNVSGANPADYTWTYAYDNANHQLSQADPLGHETDWTYDPVGNLTSLTDANNHTTSYSYDNANELLTVTAADLTETSYAYDNNGNLTSKTDANNHTTSYSYDMANRLTNSVKRGGKTWTYSYDADGNHTSTVDGNGNHDGSGGTTTYVSCFTKVAGFRARLT
jgi:YD repeat-containing protein